MATSCAPGQRIAAVSIVLACFLLMWLPCASAQDASLDISQYAHTSWKIRDGFAKGTITAIAQTPDGYLWLGTEFGLFRFDGVRATPWQPPDGQKLPDNYIRSLLAARDGTLWVGTMRGLAGWKQGKLTIVAELSGLMIGSLIEDREGTLWFGTNSVTSTVRLCAVRGANVECYGGSNSSLGRGVTSLYEDSNGNLWVGVMNGFWRWKPGAPEFFSIPGSLIEVRGFAADDQGALLLSCPLGIKRLVNGRIEDYPLPGPRQQMSTERMLRARDGSVWIGTDDRGLVHLHEGRVDEFSQAEGLTGGRVLSLFEDREGNIWVVTLDGLDRFRTYSVSTISLKQGLTNSLAGSVLAAKDGSVWISTANGLNRWEHGRISVVGRSKGADWKPIGLHSLFEDSSGMIWAATVKEFGYIDHDQFVAVREYPGGGVHAVAELPQGHLWLANEQAGLLRVFQGRVVQQIPWTELGHKDPSSALLADPARNGLWVGFYGGGVGYFADGRIQQSYSVTDGLGVGRINQLRLGPPGTLWAATEGGLSRIKDGHISTLTAKNGLPCDSVHWSMDDADHAVWLYMPCGLVRIDRSELDAWAADSTRIVKTVAFDVSDGVRVHSIAYGFSPPVTRTSDGRIWFIPLDGVSLLDPRHLPINRILPPVHIEQITADHKTYDLTSEGNGNASLPPRVRDLEIDYTALSFVAPERVLFRYKLENWDSAWQAAGTRRQAFYTNLSPGNYRFRVMACNNSGVWNEAGASLDFSIAPAYYQTTWFRLSCVAAFMGLAVALYQLRVRQVARQYSLRLDERVDERTRIARELHDTLLQNVQGLIMKLHAITQHMPAEEPSRKALESALDHADNVLAEGRQHVRSLRVQKVAYGELPKAFQRVADETAPNREASFKAVVEGSLRELHPMVRDEAYSIGREALVNALTHSHGLHIEVEIIYDSRQFRLRVRDDGRGIDPDVLEKGGREDHWGLQGMRERASKIGAQLELWSRPGAGTEVELIVPAAAAYRASSGKPMSAWFRRIWFRRISFGERR